MCLSRMMSCARSSTARSSTLTLCRPHGRQLRVTLRDDLRGGLLQVLADAPHVDASCLRPTQFLAESGDLLAASTLAVEGHCRPRCSMTNARTAGSLERSHREICAGRAVHTLCTASARSSSASRQKAWACWAWNTQF